MRALVPIALAAASAAPAQLRFTSPPGVGSDGDSVVSSLQPFNTSTSGRRFQYVVDDVSGVPGSAGEAISRIAMRPDPAAPPSTARTAMITLVLDHAVFATIGATFATNYSGTPTSHALGTVSLPATTGSSGFVIGFGLPAPFLYFGRNNTSQPAHTALLVELQTTSVVGGTTYSLDCADGTSAPVVGRSTYLGLQPCMVPPHGGGFDIIKHGPTTSGGQTTLGQHAVRGPIASFGILGIGLADPGTTLGGLLCAPVRTSLDLQVAVTSDAQGAVGSFANPWRLTFPDLAAAQSLRVFTQFALHDPPRSPPQLPVALSDAIQFDVTPPQQIDRRCLYSTTGATTASGTLMVQFVPVMQFN